MLAFLDVGFTEMLMCSLVALLLFGGRLPEIMRNLGASYRNFKRGVEDFQRTATAPVRDLMKPTPPYKPQEKKTPPAAPAKPERPEAPLGRGVDEGSTPPAPRTPAKPRSAAARPDDDGDDAPLV